MLKASVALLALSLAASPAFAQDRPWTDGWSFAVGAASDNRSKDASKTEGEPFVWGEAEWESESGLFYAGPGLETIKAGGSDVELTLAAGARPQWFGFDWDFNLAHKHRLDAEPGYDARAWEYTADMARSIGPASARLQIQHTPDGAGSVGAWTWVAARAGWDFTDRLTVEAEVGRREQTDSVDYTGGNIGVVYALTDAVELDARYHATDAGESTEQYADRFVVGISAAF